MPPEFKWYYSPHEPSRVITQRRRFEQRKYHDAYQDPKYRMGPERRADAYQQLLAVQQYEIGQPWALYDVGCGRGEVLEDAAAMGFYPVRGLEPLPMLRGCFVEWGEITDIPALANEWPAVTCFDVLEHLPPEDTTLALRELWRVASHVVLVSISNCRSVHRGVDLHPNIRSYDEWEQLLIRCWTVEGDELGADPAKPKRWAAERVEQVSETHVSRTWRAWKIEPEA